jgi:hypothetical protein
VFAEVVQLGLLSVHRCTVSAQIGAGNTDILIKRTSSFARQGAGGLMLPTGVHLCRGSSGGVHDNARGRGRAGRHDA